MYKLACPAALLFAASLSGCWPTRGGPATGNTPALNIVVTQPSNPETAVQVTAALRKSLTDSANASHGAFVPAPEFRVLRPTGELAAIHAEVSGGWGATFFGRTPAARQRQLEASLTALGKALAPNRDSKGVTLPTVKNAAATAFRTRDVVVWPAGNNANPWSAGEPAPEVTVLNDEAIFEQNLCAQAAKGGNYLIVTDPADNPPAPVKTVATVPAETPSSSAKPAPSPIVASATPHAPAATGNGDATATIPVSARGGDNIIIQMNPDKPDDPTVTLPQGSELIGVPVFFAFNSDVLDAKALETVRRDAAIIKARGTNRVILIASADSRGTADASDRYASKRGLVVEAALLMEGVVVERRIEVGARLSVKGSSTTERARSREVLIYIVPEPAGQKIVALKGNSP